MSPVQTVTHVSGMDLRYVVAGTGFEPATTRTPSVAQLTIYNIVKHNKLWRNRFFENNLASHYAKPSKFDLCQNDEEKVAN